MIDLPYSLVIEAIKNLSYFEFCSARLDGFSGWVTLWRVATARLAKV